MALETFFVFGAVSNYYRYIVLGVSLDIYLALLSTALTVILASFLILLLASYIDKKKFVKSFEE